jgi:hypothetical protein
MTVLELVNDLHAQGATVNDIVRATRLSADVVRDALTVRCSACGKELQPARGGWAVVVDGEQRGEDVRHNYCGACVERYGLWVERWR